MKILLTGVGGPAGICFAKSLSELEGLELVGVNAEKYEMCEMFVHSFHVVPFANDPSYLDVLGGIIDKEKVDYLIPLVDEELPVISANSDRIGCGVLASPPETIAYTADKQRAYEVLRDFLPKQYFKSSLMDFPVFAKPRIGRGGKGAKLFHDPQELSALDAEAYVLQEVLSGPEVTVDTLFDLDGRLVTAVPRIRAEISKGISVKGKVFQDASLLDTVKTIARRLKFIGPVNFQFMRGTGEYKLIEINARSSGGMGITISAGADIPKMLYGLLKGDDAYIGARFSEGVFPNFDEIIERQKLR